MFIMKEPLPQPLSTGEGSSSPLLWRGAGGEVKRGF